MAISTLSFTMQAGENWNAQLDTTANYTPIQNADRITKQQVYSSAIADAAVGGADEGISYLISLAASANTTVNCQSLTDVVGSTGVNLARIKGYHIRLLDPDDDATLGTNCTSIRFGSGAATPQLLNFTTTDAVNTGNTAACTIYKGGSLQYFDRRAGGFTNDNSARNIFFLNNDATNAAKIQLTLVGATS